MYNLGRFQAKVRTTEALLATLEKAYRLSPPLELDQDKQELGRIDNARQDYVIAKKLLSDCEEIAKCLRAHGGEQRASLVKEAKVQINNEETQVPFAPMILD